jgi:hypothetical protein
VSISGAAVRRADKNTAAPRSTPQASRARNPSKEKEMRFMVLMYPGERAEAAGALPDEKGIAEMMKFNEELTKAGVLLALDGLQPSSKGARITFPGGKARVQDGPFAEAKELVGGYWMLQCKSKEECVEWVKRCPDTNCERIEIRQVYEMSDFNVGPEVQAQADKVAAALPKK